MDKPKFTPGPWHLSRDLGLGRFLEDAESQPIRHNIEPSWREGSWTDDELATANAHLIAAAPRLYAALEGGNVLIEKMQRTVEAFLLPDSEITAPELVNQIIEMLDGPEQREVQGEMRAALAEA